MPSYVVTGPDGGKYRINAPDGATPEQVLSYAKQQFAGSEAAQNDPDAGSEKILGPLRRETATGQLFFEPESAQMQRLGIKDEPGMLGRLGDAIMPDDPGGAVLGGLRNAAVGLLTAPADVLGHFGVKPYAEIAQGIRRAVPEFRQSDAAGNVLQAGTQYIAPAAGGAKLATEGLGALLKNPGAVPKALAALTGASVADMAVTDPNQASTIGDLFHAGPTAIDPEDSALTRRIKVGAETVLAQPVAEGLSLAARGARTLGREVKSLLPPSQKSLENSFARALQQQVGPENIPEVVQNIDQTVADLAGSDFKPTTGSASGNNALLRLQQSQANRGPIADRLAANEEATAARLGAVTTDRATPEATGRLRPLAETEQQAATAPVRAEIAGVNDQIGRIQTDMENLGQEITSQGLTKSAASEQLDRVVRSIEQEMSNTKNALYRSVDPTGNLRRPADTLAEQLSSITRQEGQLSDAVPSRVIRMLQEDIARGEGTISFQGLVNARATLSEEIAKARMATGGTNTGGPAVSNLIRVKEAIDAQIDGFADALAPEMMDAAQRLRVAQDYYANEFGPRFKQGEGGGFRADTRGRNQPPASTTAGRFLQMGRGGGSGAREAAQDLNRILTPAPTPEMPAPTPRTGAASAKPAGDGVVDAEWEYVSKGDLPNPQQKLPAPPQAAAALPPPSNSTATQGRSVTGPLPPEARAGNTPATSAGGRATNPEAPAAAGGRPGIDYTGGRQAVRQFIMSDLAERVGSPKGLTGVRLEGWKSRFDQWARANQDVLRENRDTAEEFFRLRRQAASGSRQMSQLEQELQAATDKLGRTEAEFNQSALGLFLKNENPGDAVNAALKSSDPVRAMSQIRSLASKDTSGQAAEGVRDLVRQYLRSRLTQNAETNTGAALKPSSAQMIRMFEKEPELAKAVEDTLASSAQDVRNLRLVRTQLQQMSRRAQGTAGSITAPLVENEREAQSLLASVFAATHGLGGLSMARGRINVANFIAKQFGRDPQVVMEKMLEDAILNPEYAKMLLIRNIPENQPLIERSLRTYIANNFAGQGPERQQENREPTR